MTIKKCPRCDLNYIRDGEEYCKVCTREIKKEKAYDFTVDDICIECGENTALPGSDMCSACLLERKLSSSMSKDSVSESDLDNDIPISIELLDDDLDDKEMDGFTIHELEDELKDEFFEIEEDEEGAEIEKLMIL